MKDREFKQRLHYFDSSFFNPYLVFDFYYFKCINLIIIILIDLKFRFWNKIFSI